MVLKVVIYRTESAVKGTEMCQTLHLNDEPIRL